MSPNAPAVFWPRIPEAADRETLFTRRFCAEASRRFCRRVFPEARWSSYTPGSLLAHFVEVTASRVLIVAHRPEIVVSAEAFRLLAAAVDKGYAMALPVYPDSPNPGQRAALPAPYVNMASFEEMAGELARIRGGACLTIQENVDGTLACFSRDSLAALNLDEDLASAIQSHAAAGGAVAEQGALVHSFERRHADSRELLVDLVPPSVMRVLDVGCARGAYGRLLKARRPDVRVEGIELNPVLAEAAAQHYDRVMVGNLEALNLDGPHDLINCGDILEHLQDPWRTLGVFRDLLVPGGYLVLSVPNIGHWSVARDLLHGDFDYVPWGLLCVGHLRWFTESSLRRALERAGFRIDHFHREMPTATPQGEAFIQTAVSAGGADEISLRTLQLIVRAIKP